MKRHVPASGLGWSLVLVVLIAIMTAPVARAAQPQTVQSAPIAALASSSLPSLAAFTQTEEPLLIEGTFAVLHIDSHATGGYTRQYALTRADGQQLPLSVDEAVLEASGGYRRFEGEQVVVAVAPPAETASVAGETALVLTGVELVDGEPPLDDPHAGNPAAEFEPAETLAYVNLLCRFSDVPVTPPDAGTISDWFSISGDGLANYFDEVSYGRLHIEFTTVSQWKTLPFRYADYSSASARINAMTQTCPSLFAGEIDLGLFDGVQYLSNADWGYSLGSASWPIPYEGSTRNMAATWLSYFFGDQYAHDVLAHELGHTLGEPHSNHESTSSAYDNLWDVMSGHACGAGGGLPPFGGCLAQDFIADHKLNQGWLPPNRIYTLNGPADDTIDLDWLALGSTGGYLVATIPIEPGHYFTVEARRKDGVSYDRSLRGTAVIIHEVQRSGRPEPAWQVSALRSATSDGAPSVWLPGESYINHTHQFAVQVLAETTAGYTLRLVRGSNVAADGPALSLNLAVDAQQTGRVEVRGEIRNTGGSLGHGLGIEISTPAAPVGGGLAVLSASGADCSGATLNNGRILCTLPSLAPGATSAFTLALKPLADGAYSLAGVLFGNSTEVETSDNLAQVSFNAVAVPDLVAAIEPSFLTMSGAEASPRFWFTNTGATALDVTLQMTAPVEFRPIGANTQANASGLSCEWTPAGRRCSLAQMPPGSYVRVDLTVAMVGEVGDGSYPLAAEIQAAPPAFDSDFSNNQASGILCLGSCSPPEPLPTPTPGATPSPTPDGNPLATPVPGAPPTPTPQPGPITTPAAPFDPVAYVYLPVGER